MSKQLDFEELMEKRNDTIWNAKQPELLPDFIIGGAMKSGTTTLHTILDRHPDIAIAHDELGFFDIDNILQHSDFNFFNKTKKHWTSQSIESNSELLWNWYASQFKNLRDKARLIGEDSTTYLTSRMAAKRIAEQDKPIKMIFVLRHPTKRAISNYLHSLKSGRAIYSLEDTIRFNPSSILKRSLYLQQLQAYYSNLPHESIKIILFEDLIHDRANCIQEVCEFLQTDFNMFKESDLEVHSNKTVVPKSISLQLMRNKWIQGSRDYRYSEFLPIQPEFQNKMPLKLRLIDKIHNSINPKHADYKFKPNTSTIELLDAFFKAELEGIDELTQKNMYSKWFNT